MDEGRPSNDDADDMVPVAAVGLAASDSATGLETGLLLVTSKPMPTPKADRVGVAGSDRLLSLSLDSDVAEDVESEVRWRGKGEKVKVRDGAAVLLSSTDFSFRPFSIARMNASKERALVTL